MARQPEIVADASVVCKWYLPERGTEQALALRQAHIDGRVRLVAPDLLCYEVANALRYHRGMNAGELREAMGFFFDEQVGLIVPTRRDLSTAAQVALERSLTVYDATYAVLAERRRCPLVTDNTKLLRGSERATPLASWAPEG